ncbi:MULTISPECIES: S1/P1 nuclease [unclassified Bradyrhizobium]|uniref:S1/P1 nuclease n=1 Tax=unclassified Bradyrhizobium TaxID=2631580 RepID=UPI001CD1A4F1|nr:MULTISPECIES: S1/P1 nuclease [unclassified Bradyrhizobium]MCA1386034.1 S1/P1 nuclease [Bradyrhizobium sp. BRP05]MCA1393832.1 S1/P1 nuclease [Bradyrhizobium sp. IC3123]MCA1423476.1 S1/P1 nuclease [Bradyrhizobium sp. BRP23]MCA1430630.1 S1/P1 nuclease [Bradyrhizobium sp. NBAIM16]MCA1471207.1 S1/P1 nuclease [Bradyrhizobium sp. IC3195]
MRRIPLAIIALLAFCTSASAWGDEGHKIVCEIAYRLALPDTRAAVRKLIRADTEFDTFSESCVFPDHPRIRTQDHFVNLPRDSRGLTSDDCPLAPSCVLKAILNDSKLVNSRHEKTVDRLIALKSLGHWVGDIHQPLHVSFEDDRGGNNIRVRGECSGNLHSAWDNCLVVQAVGSDVFDAASELIDEITPEMKLKWSSSEPRDWANESFAISESVKTGYCVMHSSSCDLPEGTVAVSEDYLAVNVPIVKQQLQKAGFRLSRLLDSVFADR